MPDDQPRVRSHIPGRVRFHIPNIDGNVALAHGLERAIRRFGGIEGASANPLTSSLLIKYDRNSIRLDEILAQLNGELPKFPPAVLRLDHPGKNGPGRARPANRQAKSRDESSSEIGKLAANLALSGAVLAFFLIKRLAFGQASWAKNPRIINLASTTTILGGVPIFRNGLAALLKTRHADIDTLISTATLASLVLRESLAGLVVVWLVNLSTLFQILTLRRSRRAIEELLSVGEEWAWLVKDGVEVRVAIDQVRPGDRIAVHLGDKFPVDGIVGSGEATVNQAPITGESLPTLKGQGDPVYAGTLVELGSVEVTVTKVGDDTAIARIVRLVEEAREVQAPIQSLANRFAATFVPFSFLLSALVFLITRDIRRTMTMLVIACPCAAGLSTPTAVGAAIGNAARRGILVKGGRYLEAAGRLNAVVFDKTGTLTTGAPKVSRVISLRPGVPPERLLALAGSVELHARHPLAAAVLKHVREMEIEIPPHSEYEIIVGHGVRATIEGDQVLVGSRHMMDDFSVPIPREADGELCRMAGKGETVLYLALNGGLLGLIGVVDALRPEARAALLELRALGFERMLLVTGDESDVAEKVASALGIREVYSQVFPEEKLELIRRLQKEGYRVAMIGDGTNDAPALALAEVGMTIGDGSTDVALEAADIAFSRGDIRDIAETIRLSRHTLRVIRQNFGAAAGVNAAGVLMGALGLISPLTAALLHNLSTVAVVVNSGRLLAHRPTRGSTLGSGL